MDHERFDALTRAFGSRGTRRGTILGLLGTLLVQHRAVRADNNSGAGKGHSIGQGKGHDQGNGQGHLGDGSCDPAKCPADPVSGRPGFCCKGGYCSCGGKCCEGLCFQKGPLEGPTDEFCCAGGRQIVCTTTQGTDTCCKGECELCEAGESGIAGSYRRPGR